MKYIRTKDGVYEVAEDRKDGLWVVVKEHKPNNYNFKISLQRIIKQADTIEELCDVFILKDRDEIKIGENKYRFATKYNGFSKLYQVLREHTICETTEIYGAIWTKWGLKYVAKMNDKGELELL